MEKTTPQDHLTLTAFYNARTGMPSFFKVTRIFATRADAESFVAALPRGCKVTPTFLSSYGQIFGYAMAQANLEANGVNGGFNEAGVRRYAVIRKACDRLGVEVRYNATAGSNSYPTLEAFEAAIA